MNFKTSANIDSMQNPDFLFVDLNQVDISQMTNKSLIFFTVNSCSFLTYVCFSEKIAVSPSGQFKSEI